MIGLRVFASAMLLASVAHAENWQNVGTDEKGEVFDYDADSIKELPNGLTRLSVSAGGDEAFLVFDCHGHFAYMSPNGIVKKMNHIPTTSVAAHMERIACGKE